MLNKIGLLIVLQLWFVIGSVFAEGITIVVASEARVIGSFITLGQLAEISGEDIGRARSLGQLKLGYAPRPGSSVVLTKEILNMRLLATGSNLNDIVWTIPDSIMVISSSQSISGQTLIDKAIAATKEQVSSNVDSGDLMITGNGSVQDLITPVGTVELTTYVPYGVRYNVPTVVMVVVSVDGRVFTKVPIKIHVKKYRQVLVTSGQVSMNDVFSAENLRYESKDIGKLGAGYFTDIKKVLGMAAGRSLKSSMVITDSMLVKPIVIKRGATVNIVARIGGMEVSAVGEAMQDGVEGQMIRVKNVNSAKFISGKVLDGGTVQVLTYQRNG